MSILERNNVRVTGKNGPIILYAHGFGCSQIMWDFILPAFVDTHKQITFDYVGNGQSDASAWSAERYSNLDGYVEDILDICDELKLEKDVILVGHSVSCSIAMLASIKRPGLFSKLILVGPTPSFLNHPPSYHGGFDREDLEGLMELMDQNYLGWSDYLAPTISGEELDSITTTKFRENFGTTDPKIARAFATACFFADNREDVVKVKTPCLILQHAKDNLVPVKIGEYLHENLADSELHLLDVSGHCAHMSHPDLVISAMKSYLKI